MTGKRQRSLVGKTPKEHRAVLLLGAMGVVIGFPSVAVTWAMGADQAHAASWILVILASAVTICFACLGVGLAWRGRDISCWLAGIVILLLMMSLGLLIVGVAKATLQEMSVALPVVAYVAYGIVIIIVAVHRVASRPNAAAGDGEVG